MLYNKQIVHAFLFNIRYYSPEVIDIQLCEEELNNILLMVNNFDIKQKRYGIFTLLYATNTKTRSWRIMAKKTANFGKNTRFFL